MHQDNELSPREREVVKLVAEGKSNKEIALETRLSRATIKAYLETIRLKTGTHNRVELTNLVERSRRFEVTYRRSAVAEEQGL